MTIETGNEKERVLPRLLTPAAVLLLAAAAVYGLMREKAGLRELIYAAFPDSGVITVDAAGFYHAELDTGAVIVPASAPGYGGDVTVAVRLSRRGDVLETVILNHQETAAFMRRVLRGRFADSLAGKSFRDPFVPGQDCDAVSGATRTCAAIAGAAGTAARRFAAERLGEEGEGDERPAISWGAAETALLILFIVGIFGRSRYCRSAKQLRWISLTAGVVLLGFVFNRPFVLANINRFLNGYFPSFRTDIYIYLLLAGIIGIPLVSGKNPYCNWFCPFGGVQELFGVIGGAKNRLPGSLDRILKMLPSLLAFLAVAAALALRNSSAPSYEIFGVMFRLIGEPWQFLLLAAVIIISLIIPRPWCRYLCPLRPVTDGLRRLRSLIAGRAASQQRNT